MQNRTKDLGANDMISDLYFQLMPSLVGQRAEGYLST